MSGYQLSLVNRPLAVSNTLDEKEMVEIGLGAPVDLDALDQYINTYRVLSLLRKGFPCDTYNGTREIYERHLASLISYDEFESMSMTKGALLLFRALYA
jgi:hypothetical protein